MANAQAFSPVRCPLLVGTSGYSYAEWVDAGFYPTGTASGDMLELYARSFPVTELNYTWYQMPRDEAVERLRCKAPESFLYAAKLTRTMTHEVELRNWREEAARYRDGIAPLIQARQLLAVLVQLPPGFDRSLANRRYLAALLDALEGLPLAVEFRHASWAAPAVFEELTRRRVSLVAVDGPPLSGLFPPLTEVTNPELFYARFHGRNSRGWQSGQMQKKFDYEYSAAELQQWMEQRRPVMAAQAARGVVFFNNHVRAQAPRNARMLIRMLRQQGVRVNMPNGRGGETANRRNGAKT